MKKLILAVVLSIAFFSPAVYAKSIAGFGFGEVRNVKEGQTQGCGRGSDGKIHCVKQSWCVPLTGICFWKYSDSETKKQRELVTKTKENGNFQIVDVGGKKPEKNAEDLELQAEADALGVSKEELEAVIKEDNDFARMVREIKVKKAEQEKKVKELNGLGGGSSGGSNSGGSNSGGSNSGGSNSGGSNSGGSNSGGSNSGGSNSGGSNSGGSSSGGSSSGGSSSGGSNSGGSNSGGSSSSNGGSPSSNGGSPDFVYYAIVNNKTAYFDTPQAACNALVKGKNVSPTLTDSSGLLICGGLWGVYKQKLNDSQKRDYSNGCNDGFAKINTGSGSFSVICTKKASPSDSSGGGSVSSLGGGSNGSGQNSGGSTSSGQSGSGGGKPENSGASLGGSGGVASGGGKDSGKNSGGSQDGNSDGNGKDGSGIGSGSGDLSGSGNGNGQGKGVGDQKGDDKEMKAENEEDTDLTGIEKLILGVINAIEKMNENISAKIEAVAEKIDALASSLGHGFNDGKDGKDSNGKDGKEAGKDGDGSGEDGEGKVDKGDGKDDKPDFGSLGKDLSVDFSKAGTFSEAGSCPADIPIDLGQFGTFAFQMKFLCDAASRLRPMVVMFAWFMSLFMVYRTLSSVI